MAYMRQRQDTGGWVIRETRSDGTIKTTSVGKKKGKKAALKELARANHDECERKVGERFDGKASGTQYGLFVTDVYLPLYQDKYPRSAFKVKYQLGHTLKTFGHLNMNAGIQKWEEAWKVYKNLRLNKVALSTLRCELAAMRAALEEACSNGMSETRYSDRNPLAGIKFSKNVGKVERPRKNIFTAGELAKIYQVSGPLWGALWQLIANTGLRRGELLQLPKRLVDHDVLEVRHAPEENLWTKTNSTRFVPLNEAAQKSARVLRKASMDSPLLVPFADTTSISRRFSADRQAAGIDQGTLHDLRRTFISTLVNEAGVPIPTVMELVGHTQIKTTELYLKSTSELQKAAVRALAL